MKILLASAYYPNDTSFGAAQRTTLLHQALSKLGDVTTLILREAGELALKPDPMPGVIAEITYPERKLHQKYAAVPEIEHLVRDTVDLDEFDVVVGRYLPPLLALPAFRGRSIVDADDAYYAYPASGLSWAGPLVARAKTRARIITGRRALSRVDHVWFCCERDRDLFALPSSSILPNVVSFPELITRQDHGLDPVVLFVGALWYRPNRDAIDWFVSQCWPAIRRRVPNARFRAIGAAPVEMRARWAAAEGVECPGFVVDLADEYRRATVTVAPIQSGGGTQIKVLESLAHGRLPIVSSFVAGGFHPHLRHVEGLMVADDTNTVIDTVLLYLKDTDAAWNLAQLGHEIARKRFAVKEFMFAVTDTFAPVARRGGAGF